MPATAPNFARRAFLMAIAAPLLAGARQEILDVLTDMASDLSEGNGLAFLDRVDHSMPDFEKFQRNILALTEQYEVLSAIDVIKEEGDDHAQTAELDWILQIRSREQTGPLERRRKMVICRLERQKKNKWKVVSIQPQNFFAPPA